MKNTLFSIIYFLVSVFSIDAQNLYGTTYSGGSNGSGTINNFIPTTNNLTISKVFEWFSANPYFTNFIQASNGRLYGMAYGGSSSYGVIFSFDPTTSTFIRLKEFDNINGAYPYGSLMQASDGKLYGMTYGGGSNAAGVIFSFDLSSSVFTKVKDFDSTNGGYPYGSLMQASDGKLYGMTSGGGSNGSGVIFSFDPLTSAYAKLKDFDISNGANPYGSLTQASDGKLYGMTNGGGIKDAGVIFSFDALTTTYAKLKDFDSTNGGYPYGNVIQSNDGKLYGLTYGGGTGYGVIFSYDPVVATYAKLYEFDNSNGANPYGSLMQAVDGNIYGMTNGGGGSAGVIFSFEPSTLSYSKLVDFNGISGGSPFGSLLQGSDGKLYGMTTYGGSSSGGVIFSFDPLAIIYTKLKDFDSFEGVNPSGSLIHASDGKLYGMTEHGGNSNAVLPGGVGIIFSFDPSSSTYIKLKDFDNINDGYPSGNLIQAKDGKLYGMTPNWSGGWGNIFSFDPASSTYKKLLDFDSTKGANPAGSLIEASNGKLYGLTEYGGRVPTREGGDSYGIGDLFSFDPSTSAYSLLMNFDNSNGRTPKGSLIEATNGKLYGMTYEGGNNDVGVIFSFDPSTAIFTKLIDFNKSNGANPSGSLVQARDGKIYGMTPNGGIGYGVIFSFDPSTSNYTKLMDFDSINGANPYGNLMQASDGKLYGMTYAGGSFGLGVIFSFEPVSSTYSKLEDYNGTNGANPYIGSGFIEVPESGPLPLRVLNFSGKNAGSKNQLSWTVENEQNLDYYELQRSNNGQNFKEISQIKPVGNATYSYNDPISTSITSLYYYRIKSEDNDGKSKYSEVIKIKSYANGKLAVVSPNPFKNRLTIRVESPIQDKVTYILIDVAGRQLYKANKILVPGLNLIEINETNRICKGTYLLTIIKSQQSQTIKVVKAN